MAYKQKQAGTAATRHEAGSSSTDTPRGTFIPQEKSTQPLTRINFIIMIVAAVAIVVGFLLMLGPGTTPEKFEPDIFSTRRIVVAPTICFLGFVAMGVGIIYRPKNKS